jgi:hypothetical protein
MISQVALSAIALVSSPGILGKAGISCSLSLLCCVPKEKMEMSIRRRRPGGVGLRSELDPKNETGKKYVLGFSDEDRFNLDDEDVVCALHSIAFGTPPMLKFGKLVQAIFSWVYGKEESQLFGEEGYKCEVLRAKGGGWTKGRFRFRLEFIPDNPELFLEKTGSTEEIQQPSVVPTASESPLADLRSHLDI